MIYTYDILLNWSNEKRIKEFFEWQIDDDLEHIKKIPIIKVNNEFMKNLLISKLKVNKSFLFKIKNKTESYFHNEIDTIDYATIFTNGKIALAIEFNEEGISSYKSFMLLDEEEEVLDMSEELIVFNVDYEIIKRDRKCSYLTRKEEEVKEFLVKEIKNIKNNKEVAKINYLYKEFFNDDDVSYEFKVKTLQDEIEKDYNDFHNKLFKVLKLTNIKKNKVTGF